MNVEVEKVENPRYKVELELTRFEYLSLRAALATACLRSPDLEVKKDARQMRDLLSERL